MYSAPRILFAYLNYWFRASSGKGHGIHSPFVYSFIRDVLMDRRTHPSWASVEAARKKLKADKRLLQVDDFGAGSVSGASRLRRVSSIARLAAKAPRYSRLFFRMVAFYKPAVVLELGTSLGLTTSYLSLANPAAKVFTMEGAKEVAAVAREQFQSLALQNIRLIEGNFDQTLPVFLKEQGVINFAFIDGNHRRDPTLSYFEQLLPHAGNDSVFIFDDIHWSEEMEQSWAAIRQHPAVRCSIDLFFIGIVFFRKEFQEKQNFCIRY